MYGRRNQTAASGHIQMKDHAKSEVPRWCHYLRSAKRVDGH